jgi:hypothetical protein
MKTLLHLALVLAASAVLSLGADLTGKWKGAMPGRDGNTRDIAFDFKQEGDKLGGTMVGMMGNSVPISDGSVKGDDVKFTVKMAFGDREFTMNYEGKVAGSELQLKMTREGAPRAMEINLKKSE